MIVTLTRIKFIVTRLLKSMSSYELYIEASMADHVVRNKKQRHVAYKLFSRQHIKLSRQTSLHIIHCNKRSTMKLETMHDLVYFPYLYMSGTTQNPCTEQT